MKTIITESILTYRQIELYKLFCTKPPTRKMIEKDHIDGALQDWVSLHLKKEFSYATAYEVIYSVERISRSQIDNGCEELVEGWR